MTGAQGTTPSGMKAFRCGDVIPGCSMRCEGDVEEILTRVGQHAAVAHGVTRLDDDLQDRVRRAIRPT